MTVEMKNLFSVEGKTALVTGGSSGIGKMIATGFVQNGAKTYIASRKKEVCEEVADELSAFGTCLPLQADLSSLEGVNSLADTIKSKEGGLDILVNNSGATWGAPLDEFPESGWDKVFDLNVKAVFFLIQQLRGHLRTNATPEKPSKIVNIAPINGLTVPDLETYSYSASKAAVIHMTRVLARWLAEDKINVNAIAPGPFPSRMMRATLEEHEERIINRVPMGRVGEPEDMAATALFLASRASDYITGACIPVDGGSATTV